MRFSCLLPIDEGQGREFGTIDAIAAMAAAMDQAGVDAGSVTDHPAPSSRWLAGGGHPTLDPFVALTALASASSRLMLHTHILVLAYRNPFVVAKSAASLDALSQGLTNKLMHGPTRFLNQAEGEHKAEAGRVVRDLFSLPRDLHRDQH